jgi:rRNA maturation endonuclease Nob1
LNRNCPKCTGDVQVVGFHYGGFGRNPTTAEFECKDCSEVFSGYDLTEGPQCPICGKPDGHSEVCRECRAVPAGGEP